MVVHWGLFMELFIGFGAVCAHSLKSQSATFSSWSASNPFVKVCPDSSTIQGTRNAGAGPLRCGLNVALRLRAALSAGRTDFRTAPNSGPRVRVCPSNRGHSSYVGVPVHCGELSGEGRRRHPPPRIVTNRHQHQKKIAALPNCVPHIGHQRLNLSFVWRRSNKNSNKKLNAQANAEGGSAHGVSAIFL
jgi:hypothetical protein